MQIRRLIPLLLAGLVGILAGCRPSPPPVAPRLATTTSYLEAAAQELVGNDVAVLRLAEPGTCPGHFDIRPSQVAELRQCAALLRFDFQQALDARFAGEGSHGPAVVEVALHAGMCVPESYRVACQQIARQFVTLGLLPPGHAERALNTVAMRLDTLSREATNRVAQAGLTGLPVLASRHQRDFCEWLGLKVAATFRAADTASIAEIEEAIGAGRLGQVKLVVANLPEGHRTADALAERLGARVVVFENFPSLRQGRVSFDEMVQTNLGALLRCAAP